MVLFLPGDAVIDWNNVNFNTLTAKGIYGREIFEAWCKMTAMLQSERDLSSMIAHCFEEADFQKGLALILPALPARWN